MNIKHEFTIANRIQRVITYRNWLIIDKKLECKYDFSKICRDR